MDATPHPVPEEDLNRYATLLNEIARRVESASGALAEGATGFACDSAAAQLRIVLELIVMGGLIANRPEIEKLSTAFARKGPDDAEKLVKRVNPDYWPQQLEPQNDETKRLQQVPYLQESEWRPAWGKLSAILHARNPYDELRDWEETHSWLRDLMSRVISLLNEHMITIDADKRWAVLGQMRTPEPPHSARATPAEAID